MKSIVVTFILLLTLREIYTQTTDWAYRNPLPQNDFYSVKFFNQNTGYVFGSGGIILKNTSGSNNWITLQSGTTKNLYSSYFFDMDHGIVVGDSGMILGTSDGGTSWFNLTSSTNRALRSITFVNPNTGFAVGDNGVILKSTNSGINWILSGNANDTLYKVFFVDTSTGFIGGRNGLFLKTTDSGANWSSQLVGNGTIRDIYFISPLTGFVANSQNTIPKTTDGGVSWSTFHSAYSIQFNSIRFKDQNTGFAVGDGWFTLYRTTDQGQNWLNWFFPDICFFFVNDLSLSDTLAFMCGNNGNIFECSSNNYMYPSSRYLGGSRRDLISIAFSNENTGFVLNNKYYFRTVNSGLNWDIQLPLPCNPENGGGSFTRAFIFSSTSAYRISDNLAPTMFHWDYLQHSTDAGITWNGPRSFNQLATLVNGICEIQGVTFITIGFGGAGGPPPAVLRNNGSGWVTLVTPGITLGRLSFANQNSGIVLGSNIPPSYLRTTDGGSNWSTSSTGSSKWLSAIQMLPSGTGYISGDSALLMKTTNFGANWSILTANFTSYISEIQFVNDNSGFLLVRLNYYPYSSRVYYTREGGSNFAHISSLGNFSPRFLSFLNAETGYVCGDSGVVLKTTNGGLTFINVTGTEYPKSFSLTQNYPNPFNPVTKIKFEITNSKFETNSKTEIRIYDVLGRELSTLVNGQLKPGAYEVSWDASDFPSGVYFYKLIVGDYLETKKMVLIK